MNNYVLDVIQCEFLKLGQTYFLFFEGIDNLYSKGSYV